MKGRRIIMTTENKSVNQEVLEEMNRPVNEIETSNYNSSMTLDSKFWELALIYGKAKGKKHFTYAVKVVSKTGEHEEDYFSYTTFLSKKGEPFRQEMDDWGTCDEKEFEKLKEYAEYLKSHNIFTKSDKLDDLLCGCEEEPNDCEGIEEYKEKIRNYVANNYDSIAFKSQSNFVMGTHDGAWLDNSRMIKKYNGTVLALLNDKVDDNILQITDTKKLGQIRRQMAKDGFLIYKEPQDVTLSTGNEKKCSLFRISPDKSEE